MASEPETTTPSDQTAALVFEQRTCRVCNETKVSVPEQWPYRKTQRDKVYKAYGQVCLACEKKRKAEYEKRRDAIAAAVAPPKATVKDPVEEKRKAAIAANKLDVAQALKAGSRVLNEVAPAVMARMMLILEDPDHESHQWALEFFAQRILPRKLYEEIGAEAAGVGGSALADKRPMFQINVVTATPDAPHGRVITQEVIDVPQIEVQEKSE